MVVARVVAIVGIEASVVVVEGVVAVAVGVLAVVREDADWAI